PGCSIYLPTGTTGCQTDFERLEVQIQGLTKDNAHGLCSAKADDVAGVAFDTPDNLKRDGDVAPAHIISHRVRRQRYCHIALICHILVRGVFARTLYTVYGCFHVSKALAC